MNDYPVMPMINDDFVEKIPICIPFHYPHKLPDTTKYHKRPYFPRVHMTLKMIDTIGMKNPVHIVCNSNEDVKALEMLERDDIEIHNSRSLGLCGNRNYIRNEIQEKFPQFIMMDDDLKNIIDLDSKTKILTKQKWNDTLKEIYTKMYEEKVYVCGISACDNVYYKNKVKFTTTLKFCCGPLQFHISEPLHGICIYADELEDSLWTMIDFIRQDGKCLRNNWLSIETKWYDTKGGMSGDPEKFKQRRINAERNAKLLSANTRRSLCSIKYKKVHNEPFANLRLNYWCKPCRFYGTDEENFYNRMDYYFSDINNIVEYCYHKP